MSTQGLGNGIERRVILLEKDMYQGNGGGRNAGITSRVNSLEEGYDDMEKTLESINRKFWSIILLLITILGGVFTAVVGKHF